MREPLFPYDMGPLPMTEDADGNMVPVTNKIPRPGRSAMEIEFSNALRNPMSLRPGMMFAELARRVAWLERRIGALEGSATVPGDE